MATCRVKCAWYYNDVIMGAIASQITSLTMVYSTVYSDADRRKHQSSVSLAFVRGIHRGPVNFLHKWPVTWKMFTFDDVIMKMQHPFDVVMVAIESLVYLVQLLWNNLGRRQLTSSIWWLQMLHGQISTKSSATTMSLLGHGSWYVNV